MSAECLAEYMIGLQTTHGAITVRKCDWELDHDTPELGAIVTTGFDDRFEQQEVSALENAPEAVMHPVCDNRDDDMVDYVGLGVDLEDGVDEATGDSSEGFA